MREPTLSLNVVEMFSSLQGEGRNTGYPTTFIRLSGCNLDCAYCDTDFSKRSKMLVEKISNLVFQMGNTHVCITGGEPLLQTNTMTLVYELVEKGYVVNIETNGSVPIDECSYKRSYVFTMDVKCPSSGESSKMLLNNLLNLRSNDEVKFVVKDLYDYEYAKRVLKKYPTPAQIIFSPIMEEGSAPETEWLVESLLDDKIPNARVGVQLHKLLNYK
jgi:7-carboxy-7-deazaguanine synthase